MFIKDLFKEIVVSYVVTTLLLGMTGGIAGYVFGGMITGAVTEFELSYWARMYWYYTAIGVIAALFQIVYLAKFETRKAVASLLVSTVLIGIYAFLAHPKSVIWDRISTSEKFLVYILYVFQFLALLAMFLYHATIRLLTYIRLESVGGGRR